MDTSGDGGARGRGICGATCAWNFRVTSTADLRRQHVRRLQQVGPKRVVYEVFGPAGATADINYIDDEGETNQVNDATLPWSHEIVTTAPSMMGNIVAQGDSDLIGCRITSDGEVKDERTVNQVSAYIYCVVKSA